MLEVLKWGHRATNAFFRCIYKNGLWLTKAQAATAVQNAWDMCVVWPHLIALFHGIHPLLRKRLVA